MQCNLRTATHNTYIAFCMLCFRVTSALSCAMKQPTNQTNCFPFSIYNIVHPWARRKCPDISGVSIRFSTFRLPLEQIFIVYFPHTLYLLAVRFTFLISLVWTMYLVVDYSLFCLTPLVGVYVRTSSSLLNSLMTPRVRWSIAGAWNTSGHTPRLWGRGGGEGVSLTCSFNSDDLFLSRSNRKRSSN